MSKPLGKTIQIFLPDGNPRGVKIAEFTNRTIQVVLVPRAQHSFSRSARVIAARPSSLVALAHGNVPRG
jgi:hypothetical protein